MSLDKIKKYFPELDEKQLTQLEKLLPIYKEWNEKINVISRKDIDSLYIHHVLHALTIKAFYTFKPGSKVLDLGTGGGFPGIPLAIYFPDVHFTLIDGTAKKIRVVQAVINDLGLKNVEAVQMRAEECRQKFDMIITRAVAKSEKLLFWSRPLLKSKHIQSFPNGIIALKGGNIKEEMKEMGSHEYYEINNIYESFPESYFEDKYVVYIQG